MAKRIKTAFRPQLVPLALKCLVPSRDIDPRERHHVKYKQISASLATVGLIEPLVVFAIGDGAYRVLDGHKRLDILLARHEVSTDCLLATDDEAYTYNKRVNYLSPISEHHMILRALRHNSEERIAEALNVNVATIRQKRDLLNGICKEAVDLLKERRVSPRAFVLLRRMKPIRQIEAAQLMIASNLYSARFAGALLAGTRDDLLVDPQMHSPLKPVSPDQKLRMEQETDAVCRNLKEVEASYGTEVLALRIACRYVARVLTRAKVRRHLAGNKRELLDELDSLINAVDRDASPYPQGTRQQVATNT
jgi:hypothetical protein